jgi:hypothetical protein
MGHLRLAKGKGKRAWMPLASGARIAAFAVEMVPCKVVKTSYKDGNKSTKSQGPAVMNLERD